MKKTTVYSMAAAAWLASSALAFAQAPAGAPPAPVVGPDMAEPAPIAATPAARSFMPRELMIEMATTALDACRKRGARNTVVVMDTSGLEHFFAADDGARLNLYEAARKKTRMAATTLRPTYETVSNPNYQQLIRDLWGDTVTNVSGAVPIIVGTGPNAEIIGVMGMGGRTGPEENWCVFQGIKKVQSRLR